MFQKKIPRDSFLHALLPGPAPQLSLLLPASLPLFHRPELTSPRSFLIFNPSSFTSLSSFSTPSPPPLSLLPPPLLPSLIFSRYHSPVELKSFCTFLPVCLCQGFLLSLSHLTKGAQSHGMRIPKMLSTEDPGFIGCVRAGIATSKISGQLQLTVGNVSRSPKEQRGLLRGAQELCCQLIHESQIAPSQSPCPEEPDSSVVPSCSSTHISKYERQRQGWWHGPEVQAVEEIEAGKFKVWVTGRERAHF